MELELEDNLKAHVLQPDGTYESRIAEENFRSAPRGHSARWQSMLRKRSGRKKTAGRTGPRVYSDRE